MGDGFTTVDAIRAFAISLANTGQPLLQGDDTGVNKI